MEKALRDVLDRICKRGLFISQDGNLYCRYDDIHAVINEKIKEEKDDRISKHKKGNKCDSSSN